VRRVKDGILQFLFEQHLGCYKFGDSSSIINIVHKYKSIPKIYYFLFLCKPCIFSFLFSSYEKMGKNQFWGTGHWVSSSSSFQR